MLLLHGISSLTGDAQYAMVGKSESVLQVMVHSVGAPQQEDVCILQEDREDCFLALSSTLDGAYVTVNSSSKTSSEVIAQAYQSRTLSCAQTHRRLVLQMMTCASRSAVQRR